ncbi:23S rRNA (guanine(1835)-N(2))-methyltransferase RlmG, partial [Cumulibacter manganitolerans]|uniref:hypothetical protein n=1 Tax=Cumulibacter manganitolerans TaxID=1884992 RepID=UPI001E376391
MDQLSTPYGEISLARYPSRDPEPLLAYDAADRYLLAEAAERHAGAAAILVVGDRHGTLTTALAGVADVTMWSDSALSRIVARGNLERNGRAALVADTPPEGRYDLVVVRPGKARALLAAQLAHVAPLLEAATPVVTGDMVKHLGRWMTDVLEEQIGTTTASLASGKARLLRSVRDERRGSTPPWTSYPAPGGVLLHNAPGCFAAGGLDAGARLLL